MVIQSITFGNVEVICLWHHCHQSLRCKSLSCVRFILSSSCAGCWWLLCVTLWRSVGDTFLFFSLESGLLAAANRNHQQHPVTTSAVATPAIVPSTAGTTLKSWKTNLLMKAIQRPSITRHWKNRNLLTDFLEPKKMKKYSHKTERFNI